MCSSGTPLYGVPGTTQYNLILTKPKTMRTIHRITGSQQQSDVFVANVCILTGSRGSTGC